MESVAAAVAAWDCLLLVWYDSCGCLLLLLLLLLLSLFVLCFFEVVLRRSRCVAAGFNPKLDQRPKQAAIDFSSRRCDAMCLSNPICF